MSSKNAKTDQHAARLAEASVESALALAEAFGGRVSHLAVTRALAGRFGDVSPSEVWRALMASARLTRDAVTGYFRALLPHPSRTA